MRIEYLLVTKEEEGFCDSKEAFIKLLEANSHIKINNDKLKFNDTIDKLEIDFQIETDQIKDKKQRYFHLKLICKDESKIPELTKIGRVIKTAATKLSINNSEISTLWDDISIHYATLSYPLINEIENLMRNLILKFMIVNVGMDWTKDSLPKEVKQKISDKEKKNSEQRSQLLADKLHNADFIDLSGYLFEKYRNKEIGQLDNLISSKDSKENISFEELKKDYYPASNWDRYFSKLIDYKGETLKTEWDKLYKLRNKVAHNKTLEKKDFEEIKTLTSKIKQKLEEAINRLDQVKLTAEQKDILIQHENGETPLHHAANRGDLEEVKKLVAQGADANQRNGYGYSPLRQASEMGHLETVKFLIESGGDVNARENTDQTLLFVQSEIANLQIVKYLIDKGANVNIKTHYGYTPLHNASSFGNLDMANILIINGADINVRDEDGHSALDFASEGNHLEIAKLLIQNGAIVNTKDNENRTPLHWGTALNHLEIVKILIANNADINAKDSNGWTALQKASLHGHVEIVKYLLSKGANKEIKDYNGKTPLDIAIEMKRQEIISILTK